MEEKVFEKTCPECGELCSSREVSRVHFGAGVYVNMICPNEHKWTEYYNLNYRGFYYNGKVYDIDGKALTPGNHT